MANSPFDLEQLRGIMDQLIASNEESQRLLNAPPQQGLLNPGQTPGELFTNPSPAQNDALLQASLSLLGSSDRDPLTKSFATAAQTGLDILGKARGQARTQKLEAAFAHSAGLKDIAGIGVDILGLQPKAKTRVIQTTDADGNPISAIVPDVAGGEFPAQSKPKTGRWLTEMRNGKPTLVLRSTGEGGEELGVGGEAPPKSTASNGMPTPTRSTRDLVDSRYSEDFWDDLVEKFDMPSDGWLWTDDKDGAELRYTVTQLAELFQKDGMLAPEAIDKAVKLVEDNLIMNDTPAELAARILNTVADGSTSVVPTPPEGWSIVTDANNGS